MSTLALTDESGQLSESYSYDAYGSLLTSQDSGGNTVLIPSTRYLYTGRELDSEKKVTELLS